MTVSQWVMRLFLGKDYLVTVQQGNLKAIATIFQSCQADEQQRQILLSRSLAFLLSL